jgi:Tol biopolymer transport system component
LIFDRCNPAKYPESCRIHVYNLETGTLGYYLPPSGQTWQQAYYSDAGDKLVFVTNPVIDRSKTLFSQRNEIFLNTQIAVMNTNGSDMRILTNSQSYKGMPAFSHSGKKIIFTQAEKLRDSGPTVAAFWDLWELDLETGKLELFAGRNGFYQMGLSVYFPDDQRVLLYGDSPMWKNGVLQEQEHSHRYTYNTIYMVTRGQTVLGSLLYPDFSHASDGSLDAQGNVFFYGEETETREEGIRLRRITIDGKRTSWADPPSDEQSNVIGNNVSRDGQRFIMALHNGPRTGKDSKLMLLNIMDGSWREIMLPSEAKQINQ